MNRPDSKTDPLEFERSVLSGAPVAIIATDTSAEIVYWNEAASTLHGWSPGDAVGLDVRDLIFPKNDFEAAKEGVALALKNGHWEGEALLRRSNDSTFPAFLTLKLIGDGSKGHLIGAIHDFSERKKLEAHVLQSQKMDALGTLAGGMAHEFNNLLAGILGALGLAKHEIDGPTEVVDLLDTIESAGRRGKELVTRILTFSRSEEAATDVVDAVGVVKDLMQIIGRTLPKGIVIATELPATAPRVIGDRSRLVHALLNLCVNSRDAIGEKGNLSVVVSVVDGIAADARNTEEKAGTEFVRFEVKDDGSGMEEAVLLRVLDPFFTTKKRGEGTGLGLPLVASTAVGHGGALRIWSVLGEGSTFAMFLPTTEDVLPRTQRPHRALSEFHGTEVVLIVDDEEIVRKVAGRALKRCGYTVLEAENGREGIEIIEARQGAVDLVLLDMVMPVMDGREFFWALKETHPQIPVLLNSGFSVEGRVGQLLEAGACGFLKKPYELADLMRAVQGALEGKTSV